MSCFGREERDQRIKSKAIDNQLKEDKALFKDTHTLMLLGKLWGKMLHCVRIACMFFMYMFSMSALYCNQLCIGDEYKDTIVKQMKILYRHGFTDK